MPETPQKIAAPPTILFDDESDASPAASAPHARQATPPRAASPAASTKLMPATVRPPPFERTGPVRQPATITRIAAPVAKRPVGSAAAQRIGTRQPALTLPRVIATAALPELEPIAKASIPALPASPALPAPNEAPPPPAPRKIEPFEPVEFRDRAAIIHWSIIGFLAAYTCFGLWTGRSDVGWSIAFTVAAVALECLVKSDVSLRVTPEGIAMPRGGWREQVGWDQVQAVRRIRGGLELTLDDESRVKLPFFELRRREVARLIEVLRARVPACDVDGH